MALNLQLLRVVSRAKDVRHRLQDVVRGSECSVHDQELNSARGIELSVDLVAASKRLLAFLRTIDSITNLHSGFAVKRAILRWQEIF